MISKPWIRPLILTLGLCAGLIAQDPIESTWSGSITVSGGELHIAVHFGDKPTLDIPQQGYFGLTLEEVDTNGRVRFVLDAPAGRGVFEGNCLQGRISGSFRQKNWRGEFELRPGVLEIPGDPWHGEIDVLGMTVQVDLRLIPQNGKTEAKIDFPNQGAFGLGLEKVAATAETLHLELSGPQGSIVFSGRPRGETYEGRYLQSGIEGRFVFRKGVRPSEVEEAPPYAVENFVISRAGVRLEGSLTLPAGGEPCPGVILITGSGPQDRDETIFGFKIFAKIADHLSREGMAVLRLDDRGVGSSTGNIYQSTTEDFAEDALFAFEALSQHPRLKGQKIGLLGHSEGAMAAAIAASRSEEVAFVVLMAGPATSAEQLLMSQNKMIARALGMEEAEIQRNLAIQKRLLAGVRQGVLDDSLKLELRHMARLQMKNLPDDQRRMIPNIERYLDQVVAGQLDMALTPWFRAFVDCDPRQALERLHCPVLGLYGGKDVQVPAQENIQALQDALKRGGNTQLKVVVFDDANHLFGVGKTGLPDEYMSMEKEFVDGFLDALSQWLSELPR